MARSFLPSIIGHLTLPNLPNLKCPVSGVHSNSVFLKLGIIGGKIAVFIGSLYAIIYGWTFSHPKTK
jgi:hypothetical protein